MDEPIKRDSTWGKFKKIAQHACMLRTYNPSNFDKYIVVEFYNITESNICNGINW